MKLCSVLKGNYRTSTRASAKGAQVQAELGGYKR
mgnify:CR=1 FL=1